MKLQHLLPAPGRRWIILLTFALATLWLFAGNSTLALAATTWTVATLTDRNNASCVAGNCSLREAINSANGGSGGDTINFVSGLNGTIVLTVGALPNITKSVAMDGGGVITISGANTYRLFYVNPSVTLTLNSIILENGNSGSDYGGAVLVSQGTLVLNNTTIQNSQTNHYEGGAIFSSSGAVTLNNSVVQGNSGYDNGAISSSGTLTLTNSIVRNNTGTAGGGGLIVSGRVTISSSQIYSNTAGIGKGGALRILSGGQVSINNSQIHSNDGALGGGIYSQGTLTVTQSTLSGNLAGYGGGIYNDTGTATLTNVTLSGNNSTNGAFGGGGGIYNDTGTATLSNVTLSGNSATNGGSGGGIYNNNSTAVLTNVTLSGNSAHLGGGIGNDSATATLTNVTLSGNSVDAAFGRGGGIWHSGAAGKTITLKNTIVANSPSGGNCFKDGGSVTSITSSGFNLSSDISCTTFFNQAGDQNNQSAQLGPLANNSGFTLTHMPLPPSANGIGPIDNGTCVVSSDQRGVSRPQGVACDIGAVERKPGDFGVYLNLPLIAR